MAKSNNGSGGEVSLPALLFVIFLVLKLTHNIDWSWWWVTCPLWAGLAFVLGLAALVLLVQGAIGLYRLIFWTKKERTARKNNKSLIKALENYANTFSGRNS